MAENDNRKNRHQDRCVEGLPVIRPDVAGADIGSEEHWVCAPTVDRAGREVEKFGATTPELERMSRWLNERGVKSIAMESTGVYWVAPHEVLENHGFEVLLVSTQQLKAVPGRTKTDRYDSQWIQRLHSCGLLRGSFRPNEQICMLRTLVRDKWNLVSEAADWLRRMQKSLDQMNVRVHRAVSDIDGATGMAIIRAIVAGERDPRRLAENRDWRCKQSVEQIAEQLTGHWRADHLFSLEQALKMYDAIQERIAAYESEILRKLGEIAGKDHQRNEPPEVKNPQKARAIKKRGEEPLRQALYGICGADLTTIDAIGVETINVVVSEYGTDLRRFPTEKHFVSHLTLKPTTPISGGKPVSKKKRKGGASHRAGAALRMAALSLRNSNTALGAYYRQTARRLGGDVAVFASARKLATLIYRMLRWGQPYVDQGAAAYEQRYRQLRIASLSAAVKSLGYQMVPAQPNTAPQK
jgi:transposase